MNEIKCPECGSTISIDEDSYSNIIKQVRDQEFEDEMKKRIEILERKEEGCKNACVPRRLLVARGR